MDSNPNPYRVVYHEKARSMMNAALADLLKSGWRQDEIDLLVQKVQQRLSEDAGSFGEPHFSFDAIHLTISTGFVRPLCLQIGIQEAQHIVFVRKVTLMTTEKS